MTKLRMLYLGHIEGGPEVYRELANLVGFYVHGRTQFGEVTHVSDLRSALVMLVEEIDSQMEEPEGRALN